MKIETHGRYRGRGHGAVTGIALLNECSDIRVGQWTCVLCIFRVILTSGIFQRTSNAISFSQQVDGDTADEDLEVVPLKIVTAIEESG